MTKLAHNNGSSRNSLGEKLSLDESQSTSLRKYSADSLSNGASSDNPVSDNDSWESDTDSFEDEVRNGGGDQHKIKKSEEMEKKESGRLGSLDSGVDDGDNAGEDTEDYEDEDESEGEFQKIQCPFKLRRCQCYELNVTLTSYGHGSICPETGQQRKLQSILRAEPQIFRIVTTDKKKRNKKSKSKSQTENVSSLTSGRPRKNVGFNLPDDVTIPERDRKTPRKTNRIPVPIPIPINRAKRTLGVLKLKITGETEDESHFSSIKAQSQQNSNNNSTKSNTLKGKRPTHHHHNHNHNHVNSSHKPKVIAGPTFFHRTVKLVRGNGSSRKTNVGTPRKVVTYGELRLKQLERTLNANGENETTSTQDFAAFDSYTPDHPNIDYVVEEEEQDVFANPRDAKEENQEGVDKTGAVEKDQVDENGNIEEQENGEKALEKEETKENESKHDDVEEEDDDEDHRPKYSRRKALNYHIRQIQVEGVTQSGGQQGKKLPKVKKVPSFRTSKSSRSNGGVGHIKLDKLISIGRHLKHGDVAVVQQTPAKIVNTRYRRVPSSEKFPQFDF